MAKILEGSRIGQTATLKIGSCAAIFDETGEKLLLTRRSDNNQWCLPGGGMDPGESASDNCLREVREETGLQAEVTKLIGIYTSPDRITVYADGNQFQYVSMLFEVSVLGGELELDHESTEVGYFSRAEIDDPDLIPNHRERIPDIYAASEVTFIR